MRRLRILFLQVGLRAYNHWQYGPSMAFALLSGQLKKHCLPAIDRIHVVDGSITFQQIDQVVAFLSDYKPDIVGLGCFSYNHKLLLEYLRIIKNQNPRTITIVGGPHATLEHGTLAFNDNIDFLVIGEGELTLCELTKAIYHRADNFGKIRGIVYKDNHKPIVTPRRAFIEELSEIYQSIDHDVINYDDYDGLLSDVLTTGKEARIMTSRGCPYQCAYCHGLSGRKVRRRTIGNVVGEIEHLVNQKGLRYFKIDDDVFNSDLRWAKDFAQTLIDRQFDIRISFHNGLRADLMDEELIDLLYSAGTCHFRFAVETASQRLQKLIRKNLNLEKTLNIIKYATTTSAIVDAFFMMGFPSETKEELEQTLSFMEETGIFHPSINFLQISPNTYMQKIYERVTQRDLEGVVTSQTGGTYHRITDNGFLYSTQFLRDRFREATTKIFSDPDRIACAFETLSRNLKPDDVNIYFGLRYGFPNIMNLTADDLPNNPLGSHLKRIAVESRYLVMKGLGYKRVEPGSITAPPVERSSYISSAFLREERARCISQED